MESRGKQILFTVLTWLLCLAVLAAAGLLCYGYYAKGRNLRAVDMRNYAKVEMEDEVYTVSVDADAIVRDMHLPNPKNTTLDLSKYPDVETVYSLTFLVTPREEGGWLIQTGSDRPGAAADLRKGGLKLTNTEWVWTEQDMKNAYRAGLEYPRKLSMKKYVLCGKNSAGGYVLTVDHERLLRNTGWDLPEDDSARNAHTGYKAVLSLGYYVTPLVDGFLVETSSTLQDVYTMLLDNGVRLTDTTWVYTLSEVEELYAEQHPAQPEGSPEASLDRPNAQQAEATRTGAILDSLYHVDQTPVRTAIREAKEERYGQQLQSSQVIGNYFIVARTDEAEHGNCFRLVYQITKTGGDKEYLRADAFDVRENGLPLADVQLTARSTAEEAGGIGDFDPAAYAAYPLTEGSMVFGEDEGANPFNSDGLLFPDSLTAPIAAADVWSLPIPADKTLLTLLGYGRNEIFARCGNLFSATSVYTKLYSNYPWYQPRSTVSYASVQAKYPVAAENIDFLKSMEKLIKEG